MMGGSRTQQTLSPLLYDEVDVQLSGQGGDAISLGVMSNSIPRSGGNTFAGTVLTNGSGPGLQTSTLKSSLQGLGLTATNENPTLLLASVSRAALTRTPMGWKPSPLTVGEMVTWFWP